MDVIKMFKSFYNFIRLIFTKRKLILSMAKREVETQYVGSLLGFIWTFINPIIMIFVFWVVFSIGFKVQPKNDVPFVVWLTSGMTVWFVFADVVSGSAGIIVSNSHLIKKIVFPSQILPVVKIISCSLAHLIFLIVLMILIAIQKMPFALCYFQVVYYFIAMSLMTLGISWIVAALNVFIRDVENIVAVALQIGFWATPIFWDISMMPDNVQMILKMNPIYYIIQGYRESFIYFLPFWEHPYQTIYFWSMTILVFISGAFLFKKLKPQFADVL